MTRGIKKDVDDFITQLQGAYIPHPIKDKDGNITGSTGIQFSVRPVQLWEMVFPQESLEPVLNTFFDGQNPYGRWKKFHKFLSIFRKTMGLKPIPEGYATNARLPQMKQNIECIGIGIKEDENITASQEGI